LFESRKWQPAFDQLVRSRAIYAKLAGAGTPQQEALCNARVEEIDPSIRYCAYNLGPPTPPPRARRH
jgi:signal recognition particle subunit SRP68